MVTLKKTIPEMSFLLSVSGLVRTQAGIHVGHIPCPPWILDGESQARHHPTRIVDEIC